MEKRNAPEEFSKWIKEKWGTEQVPLGGTVPYPSAYAYKTGAWTGKHPVVIKEKCISCMNCYYYCPDNAIIMDDQMKAEVDVDFCKGCGICVKHCPKDAFEWKKK